MLFRSEAPLEYCDIHSEFDYESPIDDGFFPFPIPGINFPNNSSDNPPLTEDPVSEDVIDSID